MYRQICNFGRDYRRIVGKYWFRGFYLWLNPSVLSLFLYRFERGMFLMIGKIWSVIRIPFLPLLWFIYYLGHIDINYQTEIGPGILILHSCAGIVINGKVIIGKNITLTGGNIIGGSGKFEKGEFIIGDNCMLGANATVIGPLKIGNGVTIGASACVITNIPSESVAVGVPAKVINNLK